jgi:hypothetical protein
MKYILISILLCIAVACSSNSNNEQQVNNINISNSGNYLVENNFKLSLHLVNASSNNIYSKSNNLEFKLAISNLQDKAQTLHYPNQIIFGANLQNSLSNFHQITSASHMTGARSFINGQSESTNISYIHTKLPNEFNEVGLFQLQILYPSVSDNLLLYNYYISE